MFILTILSTVLSLAYCDGSGLGSGIASLNASNYELIYQDDFNGAELDAAVWNIIDWRSDKNGELQYYVPWNVYLENGCLVLRSLDQKHQGKPFTSGAINTRGKLSLRYGYVEIRARLPQGQGLFPAIWMLPASGASLPEVDIVEMLGHKPHEVWMVHHWQTGGARNRVYYRHSGSDYSADFHTFTLVWRAHYLAWYVDGQLIYYTRQTPGVAMFLYLNTAVGGNWPGNPDHTTRFPAYFVIDHISIYQWRPTPPRTRCSDHLGKR